jgi:hypothetical protein
MEHLARRLDPGNYRVETIAAQMPLQQESIVRTVLDKEELEVPLL